MARNNISKEDLEPSEEEDLLQVFSNNVSEEDFEEVKDFVKEEFPGAKTGKDFLGRMAFRIAAGKIREQKKGAVDINQSWSELKRENKKLLSGDYLG